MQVDVFYGDVCLAHPQAPADIKALAEFLRGKNGPKVRKGVLNGKRVEYFKGKCATGPAGGSEFEGHK
jgi:translocation protein SEC62